MFAALLAASLLLSGCGKEPFKAADRLQDTMVTVDDTELKLDDIAFLILETESSVQKQAKAYNSEEPAAYWRLHVNGRFIKDMVMDGIIGTAVHDFLFCKLANEGGIELTAGEHDVIEQKASSYYAGLSTFQKEALDLDEADILKAMERIGLAEKYSEFFCIEHRCEPEDARTDGAAYREFLKDYHVSVSSVWKEVPIGRVTLWENLPDD